MAGERLHLLVRRSESGMLLWRSAAQNSVDEYEVDPSVDPSTEGGYKGPHPIRIAQETAHHQLHAKLKCVVAGSLWMPLEVCSQAFESPGYIASGYELKRSLLA